MTGQTQCTIRRPTATRGIGIHSGAPSEISCRPGPVGSGIVFVRLDRPGSPVPALLENVTGTQRGVTLTAGSVSVRTVEHILAAAAGLDITNLLIEIRGEEVPILDGSAAPYCELLGRAGVVEQSARLEPIALSEPEWVESGDATLCAIPSPRFRITYVVPLRHPVLGPALLADVTLQDGAFLREVSSARTWGFASEIEKMRRQGLAGGASLANALAIGPDGYLNPPRMADEPARHKIVDLVGDLALLGRPLLAHVIAVGAGHALHLELARKLARRATVA